MSDLHCNCSFHNLFGSPLPFAVLEEELPIGTIGTIGNMTAEHFQVYNYMRPDAWPALRDAPVEPDPLRHLYFRSASVMRHPMGSWRAAQRQMNRLAPVAEVAMRLVANKGMVGLHVRNVFDAPRDVATAKTALGKEAVRRAATRARHSLLTMIIPTMVHSLLTRCARRSESTARRGCASFCFRPHLDLDPHLTRTVALTLPQP